MKTDLCFEFSSTDWEELEPRLDHDEAAWGDAISVFERRMKERFFTCINALVRADTRPDLKRSGSLPKASRCIPGFSIVALCCLLIETLEGFREGASRNTERQFMKFLNRPAFGGAFAGDNIAKSFVNDIRNAIFHEAETRKWIIRRNRPAGQIAVAEQDGYVLNRYPFYEAIKQEFESYVGDLRDPSNSQLRKTFREQMNGICKKA
jgi:hypothetical protein